MRKYTITTMLCVLVITSVKAQDSTLAKHIDLIFKDSCLKTLIHEALDKNTDIRMANLNIEQAEAMLRSAKLTYLPSFALAPSASSSKVSGAAFSKTYSLPLTMEWELSLGGRQKGEKQTVRASYLQAQEQLKYGQIQIIANVCNAYYTLIMLDRQYDLTGQSISNQESTLNAIRAFREVGKMDELAVNRARASLHETKASWGDLDLQRKKVETTLAVLLNRPVEAIDVKRSAWDEAVSLCIDSNSPIELRQLSSRPDVRSAEYEIAAACGNLKAAQASFYPTLRISADAGWTNNLGDIVNPGKFLLNMIGSLTQPVFSRGTIKAQKKVAEVRLKQAEIAFEKSLLTAGREVKDALDECCAVRKKQLSRRLQIDASRKAWQNCQNLLQYSQTVTYLDVLTAESSLLSALLMESSDWLEQQQALVNLYKALCPLAFENE